MFSKNSRKKISDLKFAVSDNKDVTEGYRYWITYLLDMCMDIFEWKGLPDTLPAEEIERRLIRTGFCIVFKHPVEGIIACDGNLYDYDIYRRYRKYNVYNPYKTFLMRFIPSAKLIGVDGAVIYNNSVEKYIENYDQDNLFYFTLRRYARMLADVESTLSSELITQRMPFLPVASNQQTYESVKNVFRKLEVGDMEIAIDSDFLQDFKVLKNKELSVGYLSELVDTRENILKMFYREVGMYQPDSKRERLLVDEIQQGQSNEKTLIYSLLLERLKGAEELNRMFGLDVSVGLRRELYDTNVDIVNLEGEEEEYEESEVGEIQEEEESEE